MMKRILIMLALFFSVASAHSIEKMARWNFSDGNNKELGGRYTGPGIAYLDLIKCSIKINLLSNEQIIYTYQRSGGLMLIHQIKTKSENYSKNLGLGCYTGVDLADIKKEFTRPDGSYGMSEMHRQWGEENEVKVGVKLFKGATWQGVGNVQDITTGEYPARYIFVCLFSTATKLPQALCYDRLGLPFKPKTKADTFKYVTDIFERITFIDHDQLPPDSPAIPPKPVEPSPAVPADSVQSE
ncbi:hypothetical protein [Sapientia aquatica]|uniref:Uncharacterized protein n=1 Tax=Sapientia aquatica TaxID=1549640 RepID=A0A4R5VWL0_9BURK|nr:hypothetical protein [Sapientia aquatica]TDK62716.1 hypothetical protein E2I14_15525 [Sapientia aquatica]